MHVMIVTSGFLPYPKGSSGNPVMTWAVTKELLDSGHKVTIVTFMKWRYNLLRKEALLFLENLGIKVHDLDEKLPYIPQRSERIVSRYYKMLRMGIFQRTVDYFPQVNYAPLIDDLLVQENPDVLYVYDFPAAAAVSKTKKSVPVLTAVVNLNHLHNSLRARSNKPVKNTGFKEKFHSYLNNLLTRYSDHGLEKLELKILHHANVVVEHAAHHADWLKDKGITQVLYLPNPVEDKVGRRCLELRKEYAKNRIEKRILFIGRLDSIINKPALRILAEEILPFLKMECLDVDYEVDIVGSGNIESDIFDKLNLFNVNILGFVDDADKMFLQCDILIVPTPDTLGFRTRIAEGFSFGCCIVSHESNQLGIPELIHDQNILLGNSSIELGRQIIRALRNDDLRHTIQTDARNTYEEKLNSKTICKKIMKLIEIIGSDERLLSKQNRINGLTVDSHNA